MSVKAKCPACGDEGEQGFDGIPDDCLWTCAGCYKTGTLGEWRGRKPKPEPTLTRLHHDDIEAIARRVVELME